MPQITFLYLNIFFVANNSLPKYIFCSKQCRPKCATFAPSYLGLHWLSQYSFIQQVLILHRYLIRNVSLMLSFLTYLSIELVFNCVEFEYSSLHWSCLTTHLLLTLCILLILYWMCVQLIVINFCMTHYAEWVCLYIIVPLWLYWMNVEKMFF